MKKKYLILLLIGILLFNPIIGNACAYINEAKEMNITVNNINEEYDKVLLMKDGTNIALESVMEELGIKGDKIIDNSIFSDVPPFEKEDFVFENTLKDKYAISYSIYYSYDFENVGYGTSKKYSNLEELIKEKAYDAEEAEEMRKHPEKVKCERQVDFRIDGLEEVEDASSYIKNTLGSSISLKLTDLSFLKSEFNAHDEAGTTLYLRFVKKDGSTKDLKVGSKTVTTFGCDAKEEDLVIDLAIDYVTGSIIDAQKDPVGAATSNPVKVVGSLIFIAIVSVLMSYVELSVFAVNKKKELLIIFIIMNALLLISCLYLTPIFAKQKEIVICLMVICEIVFHALKIEFYRNAIKEKKTFSDNVLAGILISIAILIFAVLLHNLIF